MKTAGKNALQGFGVIKHSFENSMLAVPSTQNQCTRKKCKPNLRWRQETGKGLCRLVDMDLNYLLAHLRMDEYS